MSDTINNKDGLLLINKVKGVTSFQEIGKIKKITGIKKCGHAGTLDKEAEGLLLVCVGRSTKLLKFLVGLNKTYEGIINFGKQTTTDDTSGEVIKEFNGNIDYNTITSALSFFRGEIEQTPPSFSAVHVNGKRAYKIALSGDTPDIKPRKVNIFNLDVLDYTDNKLLVKIDCSSGTYIRSIARDMGIKTNYYGYLSNLKRTAVGAFKIEDSQTIEDIQKENIKLISPMKILKDMKTLNIEKSTIPIFENGKKINADYFFEKPQADGFYKVISDDRLISIIIKSGDDFTYDLVY